jgi:hypothetical protein
MNIELIKEGDKVVYIPHRLLVGDRDKMILEDNLGVVTSKNDTYVFVLYKGKNNSQATRPDDLFTLRNRPDLAELLTP